MAFCSNCGNQIKGGNKFCSNCGAIANEGSGASYSQSSTTVADRGNYQTVDNTLSHLSPYYQNEFSKIQDSNEVYTGKWNWAAFLFGGIWAFSKGLWISAIIAIVGSMLTYGVIGIIYLVIFAFRGNYMYYNLVTKGKQSLF